MGFKATRKEKKYERKKKRNTKPLCGADDPGLLICKTNALRHAAREKNATMGAFGGRAKNKP